MTKASRLLDRALEMTFISDSETAERLRRLVTVMELPYDNIAARWAICRSLAEGPLPTFDNEESVNGKELRGRTLFGTGETAATLLAALIAVEGAERTKQHLRPLVLEHWRRGQVLLEADLTGALDDPDVFIKQGVDKLLGTRALAVDLGDEIIGQDELVQLAKRLLEHSQSATHSGPVALHSPLVVTGPVGSGRTHIAMAIAQAVGGDCVFFESRDFRTMAEFRQALHERSGGTPALVIVIEDLDHLEPTLVRGLAKAGKDGKVKSSRGEDIAPFSVIGTGTGSFVPAGWEELRVQPYDRDSVAQVLRNHFGWHLEVRRLLALAGRLQPGLALQRAHDLEAFAATSRVTERQAVLAMEKWGLDRLGLDTIDRLVMSQLIHGATTLSHLSDTVTVSLAQLADKVLPYLAELGLVEEFGPGEWRPTKAGQHVYGEAS